MSMRSGISDGRSAIWEFLARLFRRGVRTVSRFMTEFNGYLEEQIETITGTQAEG